ncbi:hypothetical protein K8P10_001993 [Leucobacter sp. Psy1]|uniref:glycoside hydrolase family 78 protein n=1 Tax=Leucobacter sp. Psy1 TaxID=2875729 RepID=UPI001CD67105|nr:fibronectin type III domain-containing protein [Leucobacter sp. Psy1]UBH06482.1 hypothetical protein K8P10_001993 [Leucobacter sp. Psy1]
MSIHWGAWRNHVRIGIETVMSPRSVGSGTSSVRLTHRVHLQTDRTAWITSLDITMNFSGYWGGGSRTRRITVGTNSRIVIHETSGSRATSGSRQNLSYGVSVTHPLGSSSVSRRFPIPARPAARPTAPRIDRVVRSSDVQHRPEWSRTSTYTSVTVQRSVGDGRWVQVGRPSGNPSNFTDRTTKANGRYYYRVQGHNSAGASPWSNTFGPVYTTPSAPSNVRAVRVSGGIRISATAPNPWVQSYDIRDGNTTVATGVQLPWTHQNPDPAVTHRYTVRARRGTLLGSWSSASNTVELQAPPKAPTALTPNGGALDGDSPLILRWQHNPADASEQTRRRIEFQRPGETSWRLLGEIRTADEFVLINDPATQLGAGSYGSVSWRVRTWGDHANASPWSATATFELVERPGVAILSPEDGLLFRPELALEWSWFQSQDRPQSAWQVEVRDSDDIVILERDGQGATSTLEQGALFADGESYVVRVRAATGDVWSEWAEANVEVEFIAPLPPVLDGRWNEDAGSVSVEVGEGDITSVAIATNRVINPSFESDATTDVEVYRNGYPNPAMGGAWRVLVHENRIPSPIMQSANSTRGWSGASLAFADGAIRASASMYSALIPVTAGESITVEFKVASTTLSAQPKVALGYVSGLANNWTSVVSEDTPVSAINTEETKRVTFVVPSGYTELRLGFSRNNFGIGTLQGNIRLRHITTAPGVIFDGSVSDDPDLTPAWGTLDSPGIENESASRLYGWRPAGLTAAYCIPIVSTRYTKNGIPSLRLISTAESSSTDAFVWANIPEEFQSGGVAEVYSYLEKPLEGSIKSYYASLSLRNPLARSNRSSNSRGEQLHRIEFGAMSDTYRFQMIHGGLRGSGDVWFVLPGIWAPGYAGPWFHGEESPDEDMEARWTGARFNSSCVLVGQRPPGIAVVYGSCIKSSRWAAEGDYSLRLVSNRPGGSVTAARFWADPSPAAEGARIVATAYLDRDRPASASPRLGTIDALTPSPTRSVAHSGVAGAEELEIYTSPGTGTVSMQLVGGVQGDPDVWFDRVGIILESYRGDWFDGDSDSVDTGLGFNRARWDGVRDNSTSSLIRPADTVRTEVYRSIDSGETWELLAADLPPSADLEDWESLSAGETMYRAIAFSDIGATAVAEITVIADSPALWLSGSDGYIVAARMPYDAEVQVTSGRARTAQHYEGRPHAVAYAGEALTRSVQAGGRLVRHGDGNASLELLQDLANAVHPVHLYRDPTGVRIYGSCSDISWTHEAAMVWKVSFGLNETER